MHVGARENSRRNKEMTYQQVFTVSVMCQSSPVTQSGQQKYGDDDQHRCRNRDDSLGVDVQESQKIDLKQIAHDKALR